MHVVNYDAGLNKSSGFVYSNLAFRHFNYFSNPAPERFDICTFGSLDQQACLKDIKTEVKEEVPKKGQQHVKTEIKEESLKGMDERVKEEITQKAEVRTGVSAKTEVCFTGTSHCFSTSGTRLEQ